MAAEEMVGHYECPSFPEKLEHVGRNLLKKSSTCLDNTGAAPSPNPFQSRRASASQQNIAWRRVRLRAHVGG